MDTPSHLRLSERIVIKPVGDRATEHCDGVGEGKGEGGGDGGFAG